MVSSSAESIVRQYLAQIAKGDRKINAFIELNPNVVAEARALDAKKKKGRLYGKVIAVKSNINVKGLTCSCASKALDGYRAPYDAAVIEKIRAEDGVIIGMTNMDEFASGWSGETSAFGPTLNPAVPGHVAGGSSSGSAAAVAAGFCDMALGSETGGSVRVPASFCGIVGVKPSYGAVSRYGLVDLSMSLDQVAPIARTVADAALLFDVISGNDERDCNSIDIGSVMPSKTSKLRVGVLHVPGVHSAVQAHTDAFVAHCVSRLGWSSARAEVAHLEVGLQTYFPIVWAEFFSATRRFDGRRYGKRIEDAAGREVLRRIYGGSEIVKAEAAGRYYFKALHVRAAIRDAFERALEKFDCLVTPTVSVAPFKPGTKVRFEDLAAIDLITCPVNLAGICASSVPSGLFESKPLGLQIICGAGKDKDLMSISDAFERAGSSFKN